MAEMFARNEHVRGYRTPGFELDDTDTEARFCKHHITYVGHRYSKSSVYVYWACNSLARHDATVGTVANALAFIPLLILYNAYTFREDRASEQIYGGVIREPNLCASGQ